MSRKKKKDIDELTCADFDNIPNAVREDLIHAMIEMLVHTARHHDLQPMRLMAWVSDTYMKYEDSYTCTASHLYKIEHEGEEEETPRSSLTPEEQEAARRLLDF